MEDHLKLKKKSRDQQSLGTFGKTILPQASQSLNQRDKFKPEKPKLSYADIHHDIIKNVKDFSPKYTGDLQKQWTNRGESEEEELVKYMSSLPSYLERGENPQEKVLNVGVLDWGRLEKWQYCHKQIPLRSRQYSLSSSTSSSSFSTEGSSVQTSRGHSCSPARQRMRRPSLKFHLMSSPIEGHSQVYKSSGESVGKFQDVNASPGKTIKEKGKSIRTDTHFSRSHPEIKLEQSKTKDLYPKVNPAYGNLPSEVKYGMTSCTKVKTKTQKGDFMKRREKLKEQNSYVVDEIDSGESKTVVLLLPRDLPQNNHSGLSQLSDSAMVLDQRPAEAASRRSFSEISKEVYHAEFDSDIPHSCPLPCEADVSKLSQMKQCSKNAESVNISSDSFHSVSCSAKIGISPSRARNQEEEKSTSTSKGADMKVGKIAAEKVRSTSPFRRFSIGMGKMSKSFSSKESLSTLQLSSVHTSTKSGSENAGGSSCQDTTSRARSSPLRRLLDPLLKPKMANCRYVREPLQGDSIMTERACKSSNGRLDSSTKTLQSVKVKLDMTGCRTIDVNGSSQDKTRAPSTIQAFLRVAVKHGLPLFTFVVDNDSDILAAKMKKLNTSRKDENSCIYTFFTIQDVKKKNGRWINQGGKGKGQDYIPNVVAQMKVSGSQLSNLTRQNCMDLSSMKEFVLFSVDLRQADQQTSYFQPSDELAAIVVRIPKMMSRDSTRDGQRSDNHCDLPKVRLQDCLPAVRCHSNSGENVQNRPIVCNQGLIRATAILPSGVHSLPSKGEPSSLIQRWKSGGSCDCGGWDLGCKLRVLANWSQVSKKPGPSKACSFADQFELFSQDEVQANQPFFSLVPIKDGIYSVEFNPSLSLLQAFSISIAVLDSRKPFELSESSSSFEGKTSSETISIPNDGIRAPNLIEGEVPARYVSYPPLSPVGRV